MEGEMTYIRERDPTEQEIQENLVKVKNGEALTIPLSILDGEFKRRYFNQFKWNPKTLKCKECGKEFMQKQHSQIYCSKECCKERQRKYNQEPRAKQKRKEYSKKYLQRPEVKERKRKYGREYNQRPEVKERIREYAREYNRKDYRKRNNVPKSKWRVK